MPEFDDLLAVLAEIGVHPEVAELAYESRRTYRDLDEALDEVSSALGERWEPRRGRAWLESRLELGADGSVVYDAGPTRTGVAHWAPRRS